ncbi:hypothetical protein ACW9YQ_32255 (plasmid) [Paraburkholderia strydomiana]
MTMIEDRVNEPRAAGVVTRSIAGTTASKGAEQGELLAGNVWRDRVRLFAMVRADIAWAEGMQTPQALKWKRQWLVDPFLTFRLGHATITLERRRVKRVREPERDSLWLARLAWLWEKSGQLTRLGRPFDLMRHPWEDCAQAQAMVQAAMSGRDFRRLAQYRRACRGAFLGHRPHGEEYPTWLKPQRRAKVASVRRLKKDKALEADDPRHRVGDRHELRQVFEATERRDEQLMMAEIIIAVYGEPPSWMVARAADKPGPKRKRRAGVRPCADAR